MNKIVTAIVAILATLGLTFGLAACAPQTVDMSTVTAVIDVRTPAEFAEGHLDGAVNIDWEGATFADEISQLDPAGTYILYCRSGNRAGQALAAMEGMGFADLTNAGGLDAAAAVTGLDIVR